MNLNRRQFVNGLTLAGTARATRHPTNTSMLFRVSRNCLMASGAITIQRMPCVSTLFACPQKILAQGTDWRFLNELKKELEG
jgi:hypothetical protein